MTKEKAFSVQDDEEQALFRRISSSSRWAFGGSPQAQFLTRSNAFAHKTG
jgi:hypothetical protein